MIRQDGISIGFTITALFLSLYWSTGDKSFIGIFPAILLISSFGLNFYIGQTYPKTSGDAGNTLLYTMVAVAGMYFTGYFTQNYFVPQTTIELSGIDAIQYGILMAVAEEQFFRGALLNFLQPRFGEVLSVLASAGIFTIYHFFIYAGMVSTLLYVLGAGVLLAFVTVRSRSITPAICAHVINNVMSVM